MVRVVNNLIREVIIMAREVDNMIRISWPDC